MPITIFEKDPNSAHGVNWINYKTRKSYNMTDVIKEIQSALSNIKTLCLNKVQSDYGKDSILGADVILLSRDGSEEQPGALRGFAALLTNKAKGRVYIDLICNAQASKRKTRSNTFTPSGKDLLNAIKKYTEKNRYKYIELKALEHVITYYYRFGWRFISQCGAKENRARDEQVKNLLAVLKAAGDPDKYNEEDEAAVAKALQPFKGYQKGRYCEKKATGTATAAAATARSGAYNREELVDDYCDTREILEEGLSENGYTMIWCVNDPTGAKAAPPAPAPAGAVKTAGEVARGVWGRLVSGARVVAARARRTARDLGHKIAAAGKGAAEADWPDRVLAPQGGGNKTRKSRRRRKRRKTRRKRKKTRRKRKKTRRKRRRTRRKTKRRGRR